MSAVEVFLWPLAGFFTIAALGAAWQARNPAEEAAARRKLLPLQSRFERWKQMPQWDAYQAQQQDPRRIARSGKRAATLYAMIAAAILAYLLTRS